MMVEHRPDPHVLDHGEHGHDAHGLAVMSSRHIAVCWSTDRHLGLTGVTLVM